MCRPSGIAFAPSPPRVFTIDDIQEVGVATNDSRLMAHGALAVLVCLVASGCISRPAEPVAPRWDVGLTIPVTSTDYTLLDLVEKDTTLLRRDATNQIFYGTRVMADPTAVGDRIAISGISVDASVTLGPFGVGPVPPTSGAVSLPGVTGGSPLPPVKGFSAPPVTVRTTLFTEVELTAGTVTLRVRNNLPVPLTIDSTVTLRDSLGRVVSGFSFSPATIGPGAEATASADLAGKLLTGRMTLANICLSEEGGGIAPAGDLVVATLSTGPLIAWRAILTSVPAQYLIDNSRFTSPIRDSIKIQEVWIKSGQLTYEIQSQVPMNMRFRLRFDQLLDGLGRPYTDSLMVPTNGTTARTISLSGLRMVAPAGGFMERLEIVGSVDLYEGSRGQPVTVRETDNIRVVASSSTIIADSAVAVVKPTVIAINEAVALNLGDLSGRFLGSIDIPSANLSLEPMSDIALPMLLDLSLRARDAVGQEVVLAVPPTKSTGKLSTISFSPREVGAFLSRLSSSLPDSIRIVGNVVLNPDYDTLHAGTVGSRCTFGGLVDLSIPLNLSVAGTFADTLAFGDTTGDGNSDYRENRELLESMNSGSIHLLVDSEIPLRCASKVVLLDRFHQPVLWFPQIDGDSLLVNAPPVSGGEVTGSARTLQTLPLSAAEIRSLERVKFVRLVLGLSSAGTGPVRFRSTGHFRARVWSEMSYRVEP